MLRFSFIIFFCAFALACATPYELDPELRQPELAERWQQSQHISEVQLGWIDQLQDEQILSFVEQALLSNYALKQQYYQMLSSAEQLQISESELWPSLDLSAQLSRSKDNRPISYRNATGVDLSMSYEIDVWGKLTAQKRQALYQYRSRQYSYQQSRQQLVADVLIAWFNVIANQQLYDIYQGRVGLAEQNLSIIEQGYRQGLNEALDVYLSRNDLASEQSSASAQFSSLQLAKRTLERLVGDYPAARVLTKAELPLLNDSIDVGVPSELVTRKPQLQSAWYSLLAEDSALAYAHKQRYPSLNLAASIGDSTNEVSDLFSPSSLAWSLMGGISAPLFDAGRLKANEEVARLSLKEAEQGYLDTLYGAFADVETAMTDEQSLQLQYQQMLSAQSNAEQAYSLAFEQYRAGLESYTTVLDAQERAYNAQSSLINIKRQLLTNRINLHLALGGDFAKPETDSSEP